MNYDKKRTRIKRVLSVVKTIGVPGGIRTPDLLVRSQSLYPAELQAHIVSHNDINYTTDGKVCQAFFSKKLDFFKKSLFEAQMRGFLKIHN